MATSRTSDSDYTFTPSTEPRVLGISASPRKNGNSDVLLNRFADTLVKQGIFVEKVRLIDYQFQSCIGCEKCREKPTCTGLNDGMQLLYPKITESRGIILISPTHNYNITAWMKAFIDRLYCYYIFKNVRPRSWSSRLAGQGRKAIIASIGEQSNREEAVGLTLDAMRIPIEALGYEVVSELAIMGIFDKGKVKDDTDSLEQAYILAQKLSAAITTT